MCVTKRECVRLDREDSRTIDRQFHRPVPSKGRGIQRLATRETEGSIPADDSIPHQALHSVAGDHSQAASGRFDHFTDPDTDAYSPRRLEDGLDVCGVGINPCRRVVQEIIVPDLDSDTGEGFAADAIDLAESRG